MSNPTTKTITLTGPIHDVFCFMSDFAVAVSHDENHPPVRHETSGTGPYYWVETVLSFTSFGEETLQDACELVERYPTLHCALTPASAVEPTPALMSRMRRGEGIIEFVATEEQSADNPMNDMTHDEKFSYVLGLFGTTREALMSIEETGIQD